MKAITGIFLALVIVCACWGESPRDDNAPKDGYVPTKDVAIKIAVAVWEPIYGADKIADEKPYKATLSEGIWTVRGSLPDGAKGGTAAAEISKKDGRIIGVWHEK